MAEWLGTGLQNLLQRFDSASHLPQKSPWNEPRGFFVSRNEVDTLFCVCKKKSVGLSQADALTNHIINNTKTNNQ